MVHKENKPPVNIMTKYEIITLYREWRLTDKYEFLELIKKILKIWITFLYFLLQEFSKLYVQLSIHKC